jgi:hypothetical protein
LRFKGRRGSYTAVAVKICILELPFERRISPNANMAVKRAMSPRVIPMVRTLARITIAIVGRRQATIVVTMDVKLIILNPEYSVRFLTATREFVVVFVDLMA